MPSRTDPQTSELVARLGGYTRTILRAAEAFAVRLHAEELCPEHVLVALLLDESAAGTRIVLRAFADPETIAIEVTALCPGILVVGSGRSLPFSVRGVRALEHAATTPGAPVTPTELYLGALNELEMELASHFERPPRALGSALSSSTASFLERTTVDARRALGSSCREATRLGRAAIAPAHLVLGCLDIDADLRERAGLGLSRARLLLSGHDEDLTPLPERTVPLSPLLGDFLKTLPAGADTARLLAHFLTAGSEELRLLLAQQKVTPKLLEGAVGTLEDPRPA